MINYTIFVGLDVHKDSITVAMAKSGRQDVESIGFIINDSTSIMKMVKRLEEKGGEHIYAIEGCDSRVSRFEKEIEAQSQDGPYQKTMAALQGLKGVALITSATIISEVGDLTRFKNPRQLMAYAGLVPSESSGGNSIKRGSITKTGNSHLRKVIVEAAWHYRHRPTLGTGLKKRQEELPEEIKQISWKAQHRLNLKFRRMAATGKPSQKAVVGVARELLGFIWAIGQAVRIENELSEAV